MRTSIPFESIVGLSEGLCHPHVPGLLRARWYSRAGFGHVLLMKARIAWISPSDSELSNAGMSLSYPGTIAAKPFFVIVNNSSSL